MCQLDPKSFNVELRSDSRMKSGINGYASKLLDMPHESESRLCQNKDSMTDLASNIIRFEVEFHRFQLD
jgi:hypothetical protein